MMQTRVEIMKITVGMKVIDSTLLVFNNYIVVYTINTHSEICLFVKSHRIL